MSICFKLKLWNNYPILIVFGKNFKQRQITNRISLMNDNNEQNYFYKTWITNVMKCYTFKLCILYILWVMIDSIILGMVFYNGHHKHSYMSNYNNILGLEINLNSLTLRRNTYIVVYLYNITGTMYIYTIDGSINLKLNVFGMTLRYWQLS